MPIIHHHTTEQSDALPWVILIIVIILIILFGFWYWGRPTVGTYRVVEQHVTIPGG
jgi:hypothetical protein